MKTFRQFMEAKEEPFVGMEFHHKRVLNPDKTPMKYRVTKIAQGSVYYKPVDGGNSEYTSREHFPKIILEAFNPDHIAIANKTSRTQGAIGGTNALAPRYLEYIISQHHKVLDFGAGKDAAHTQTLRKKGFNVTAHEFGANFRKGIHDPDALARKYDHVLSSNVLNVQSSHSMLKQTLDQIHGVLKRKGHLIANLPASPRKWKGLTSELIHNELSRRFHKVQQHGTKAAPIFHASYPKR